MIAITHQLSQVLFQLANLAHDRSRISHPKRLAHARAMLHEQFENAEVCSGTDAAFPSLRRNGGNSLCTFIEAPHGATVADELFKVEIIGQSVGRSSQRRA
jgi:hypothetical protein